MQETVVWQAGKGTRLAASVIMAVLVVLSAFFLIRFGWLAVIGVLLVLAAVGQAYWVILRPRMTAGPDGLEIINGRDTTRLAWKDVRSAEPGLTGFTVVATDGRRIVSRHPLQTQPAAKDPTEADTAAAFIAQRAAWERKQSGERPEYVYPPNR